MNPNLKEILIAMTAAAVVVAAALVPVKAKAGPLDYGPHILVAIAVAPPFGAVTLNIFASKQECEAEKVNVRREYVTDNIILACIPGREA